LVELQFWITDFTTIIITATQLFSIYLFEILEDFEATKLLFNAAMSWAKGRGLDEMIGPKGFTALNGLGMLTRGFEHRPVLGIPYNHPYYAYIPA